MRELLVHDSYYHCDCHYCDDLCYRNYCNYYNYCQLLVLSLQLPLHLPPLILQLLTRLVILLL